MVFVYFKNPKDWDKIFGNSAFDKAVKPNIYIYGTAQIIQQTMLNIVKGPEQASLQRRNIHGQEIWKYMQYN